MWHRQESSKSEGGTQFSIWLLSQTFFLHWNCLIRDFFFRHFFYYSFFFLMKLIILLLMNMNTWVIKTSKNKHNKIAKNGRNNYSLLENTGPCGFWIIAFPIFIIYFYSLSFVFIHLTKFDSRPTFAFLFFEQVQMVAIIKYVLLPFCRK